MTNPLLEPWDAPFGLPPFAEIADGWQVSHEGRFTYTGTKLRSSFGWNAFIEDGRQNVPFATEEGTFLQCLSSLFGAPLVPGIACVAPNGSVPASGSNSDAASSWRARAPRWWCPM